MELQSGAKISNGSCKISWYDIFVHWQRTC